MVAIIEATSTLPPAESVGATRLEETGSFSFEPTVTPRREEANGFAFDTATTPGVEAKTEKATEFSFDMPNANTPSGVRTKTEKTTEFSFDMPNANTPSGVRPKTEKATEFSFDAPNANTPSGVKAKTEKTTEFSFDAPVATTTNGQRSSGRTSFNNQVAGSGKALEFDFEQALTSEPNEEAEFNFEPQIHNAMVAVIEATSTPPSNGLEANHAPDSSGGMGDLVHPNKTAYSPVTPGHFLPFEAEERGNSSKFFRLAQTNLPPATMTRLKQDISFVAHYNGPKPDLSWLVKRVAVVELEGYMIIDRRKESQPYYAMLFFQYGQYVAVAFDDGNQIVESEAALHRLFQAEPPALSQITIGRVAPGLLNAYFALELPAPDKLKNLLCREINVRERVNWLAYNKFTGALKFYTSNRAIFYLMHEGQGLGGYEVVEGVMQKSETPLDYFVAEPGARLDVHPAPTKKPLPNWAFL
jgi:hypothetical protein